MNIELKLVRISLQSIVKMVAIAAVFVNVAAWIMITYGLEESLLDLFSEEWILLELISLLVGFLLALSTSKAEIICFYGNRSLLVSQRLERLMKINSYKRVSTLGDVEVWDYSSFFKRCLNLFESDIRIESTERMLKVFGPKKYVMHVKNKLIWSRDFAPDKKIQEEELAEV